MSWDFLSKEVLLSTDHTVVENWRMKTHRKQEQDFDVLVYPDAAFVFALTEDKEVLMLEQFSVAAQDYINHLVAGYVEKDETPEQAAQRELEEETGRKAKNINKVGKTNRSKWATGDYHFFIATELKKTGNRELDSAEDIEVKPTPVEEFKQILTNSRLDAAGSVACAYAALNFLDEL